jgi:hypothetical protein
METSPDRGILLVWPASESYFLVVPPGTRRSPCDRSSTLSFASVEPGRQTRVDCCLVLEIIS